MVTDTLRLEGFFRALDQWGLTDVMLPFLLIFVIVYAVLMKTKILGNEKKNLNVVVALVTAFITVIPHVTGGFPANADPVLIIKGSLPSISIVLVAVVFLLILIGVFAQDYVFLGLSMPGWIAFFSFVVIIIVFGGAANWWAGDFGQTLTNFFGTDAIAVAIMLLTFGIIIAWTTSESKEKEDDKTILNRLGMDFSKLFGKK